jgi:hypothetical protein
LQHIPVERRVLLLEKRVNDLEGMLRQLLAEARSPAFFAQHRKRMDALGQAPSPPLVQVTDSGNT